MRALLSVLGVQFVAVVILIGAENPRFTSIDWVPGRELRLRFEEGNPGEWCHELETLAGVAPGAIWSAVSNATSISRGRTTREVLVPVPPAAPAFFRLRAVPVTARLNDPRFTGSGMVALIARGLNLAPFAAMGACDAPDRICRSGSAYPQYTLLKSVEEGKRFVGWEQNYYWADRGFTPYISRYGIWKPGIRVAYSKAVTPAGASPAYPMTSADGVVEWDLGRWNSSVTRLGAIIGFGSDAVSGWLRVEINGDASLANLCSTVAQAVAQGQMTPSERDSLIASGHLHGDADRVLDTRLAAVRRTSNNNWNHIPLADGLPPGLYTVRFTLMAHPAKADRAYLVALTYGTPSLTHESAGAYLYEWGPIASGSDESASEQFLLSGRPASDPDVPNRFMGCGHGGELTTDYSCRVDGAPVRLTYATTQRQRTGSEDTPANTCRLTIGPHTLRVGEVVDVLGLTAGAGYEQPEATLTAVGDTWIEFPAASGMSGEPSTADETGRIASWRIVTGSEILFEKWSALVHRDYSGGATEPLGHKFETWKLTADGMVYDTSVNWTQDVILTTGCYLINHTVWTARAGFPGRRQASFRPAECASPFQMVGSDDSEQNHHWGDVLAWSDGDPDGPRPGIAERWGVLYENVSTYSRQLLAQDRAGGLVDKWYHRAFFPPGAALTSVSAGTSWRVIAFCDFTLYEGSGLDRF